MILDQASLSIKPEWANHKINTNTLRHGKHGRGRNRVCAWDYDVAYKRTHPWHVAAIQHTKHTCQLAESHTKDDRSPAWPLGLGQRPRGTSEKTVCGSQGTHKNTMLA